MSAAMMDASMAQAGAAGAQGRPSFLGLVSGELFKIGRQWLTWIMLVLLAGLVIFPYLVFFGGADGKTRVHDQPLYMLSNLMEADMLVLRVFMGVFLIILTARLIGMEYQYGTIRIILSRGVGRLQLLGAQLLTITMVGIATLAGLLALNWVMTLVSVGLSQGNLDALKALNTDFWHGTTLYVLTILVSMGATVLLTTALTVLGRSLAVGMGGAFAWFAADNLGWILIFLAYRITNSTFWTLLTGDLLGQNLNVMAAEVLPKTLPQGGLRAFFTPLVPVTGGHTLLIAGLYSAAFAVAAVVLTWRRDVKE